MASMLLDQGFQVSGADVPYRSSASRLQEWRLENLTGRPGFTFCSVDICDIHALRDVLTGKGESEQISAVINLAALAGVRRSVEDPRAYYEVNVLGALNLLELSREFNVGRFILASTSSVYGAEIQWTRSLKTRIPAIPCLPMRPPRRRRRRCCTRITTSTALTLWYCDTSPYMARPGART